MKYFLMGAFASGFLLYGIALVFGAYGSTNLIEIAHRLKIGVNYSQVLSSAGLILISGWAWLQGGNRAISHVGSRCLRGFGRARYGLYVSWPKGCGLRGAIQDIRSLLAGNKR